MLITTGNKKIFQHSHSCTRSILYSCKKTGRAVYIPGLSKICPRVLAYDQTDQKSTLQQPDKNKNNKNGIKNGVARRNGNIQPDLKQEGFLENSYKYATKTQILHEERNLNEINGEPQIFHIDSELTDLKLMENRNQKQLSNMDTVLKQTTHSVTQGAQIQQTEAEKISQNQIPDRWKVIIMMAVAFILCNMDKVNMSVAVIPMAQDLGWTALQRGLVSSAFFWGYSLTQIPAGYIATKIGGGMVLIAGVITWSVGTLITPSAAHFGIWYLFAARVLVGLGEGLAPSAVTNVMASSIPESERARAVTTVFGGLDVGSVVGLVACGPLIHYFGWPSVFHVFAILGFAWAALWPRFKKIKPQAKIPNQVPVVPNQKQNIRAEQLFKQEPYESKQTSQEQKVPYGKFFKSPAVWAVIAAHFCFNWGYYTLLAWLPSYFELALGLNVQKSSLLTLIPYIAMTFMTCIVGPTADSWVKQGWKITTVRKTAQGISLLGAAICMIACAFMSPSQGTVLKGTVVWILVGVMSLSFMFSAWARAGLYCNHQDLSPKYAGALLGISNTFGALPGVLGVTTVGYLLDVTASWSLALFIPMVCIQIIGFVVYTLFASSERQPWQ